MELNLHQSIQLATKAHEGQFRLSVAKCIPDLESYSKIRPDNKVERTFLANMYNVAKPYITHPLEVMRMMTTEEEQIVGVLHDVFEKCPGWCLGRVMNNSKFYIKDRSENIEYITTANVYWALMLISKDKHIPYDAYIQKLISDIKLDGRPNKLAIKVKLADIICNLADNPSEYAKQKYAKALPILLQGI